MAFVIISHCALLEDKNKTSSLLVQTNWDTLEEKTYTERKEIKKAELERHSKKF